jgi:putative SOS response-associated peptidase YedK
MCGRYTLRTKLNLLLSTFAAELEPGVDWEPRYNIAPGEKKPASAAVRLVDGKRQLTRFWWPFVPSWSPTKKLKYKTDNARADRVATAPAYRAAYRKRRCLVLADGYVEWEKQGTGRNRVKLPWLYEIDGGKPFAIAGLWEAWHDPQLPDAAPYESCTLIVTEGNDLMRRIGHERMPVILDEADYDAWLHCEEIPLVPFPADRMTERRMSTYINNSRNEGPECLATPS